MINKDEYRKILNGTQGTVVKDFNNLISFIEKKGSLTLTKSETAFSISDLSSINDSLSNPQKMGLARPQQKAFPYINCLYVLLRLSSLTFVKKEKNKSVIQIDQSIANFWKQLSQVEQYGHLLTYFLNPKGEDIIGEKSFNIFDYTWLSNTSNQILENFNGKPRCFILDYQIAALELFGILSIKQAPLIAGKGWNYESIKKTPYGNDLLKFISTSVNKKYDLFSQDSVFSMLQSLFPDLKTPLINHKKEVQSGVHVFKVSLGSVWRQIAVNGNLDLESFSDAILEAFEFDNDHLHEFSYKNRQGLLEKIYHSYCDEDISSNEVTVGELNLQIGSEIKYLFDFGDSWCFQIVLEELDPKGLKIKEPVLLKKHGEAIEQYADWDMIN